MLSVLITIALKSLLTVNTHVSTPFTAAVLGAYVVLLPRRPSPVLAAAVGLVAGMNAASDPLLWVAGIAPFAIAAAVLLARSRRTDLTLCAGITIGLAIAAAIATNVVMHALDFHILGTDLGLTHVSDIPSNTVNLGRAVALLGGANYAIPGPYPHEPFRILLALLVFAGILAAVVSPVRALVRRTETSALAFASFWGAAVVLLGIAYVSTTQAAAQGAGSVNYLFTLAPAAGAGVGLLARGSRTAQLAAALAIAVVGAINVAGIVHGRATTSAGALGAYKQPMMRLLAQKGVARGYAGFFDASNLTWQSGMRLLVAPVSRCDPDLCTYRFFTIASWFDERPGRSFLLVDPERGFLDKPPPVARDASESFRFGPLTVYLFDYDLARRIRPEQQ